MCTAQMTLARGAKMITPKQARQHLRERLNKRCGLACFSFAFCELAGPGVMVKLIFFSPARSAGTLLSHATQL